MIRSIELRIYALRLGTVPSLPRIHVRRKEFRRCTGLATAIVNSSTRLGATRDVTIDELRIECMFPVDAATAELCRELAATSPKV